MASGIGTIIYPVKDLAQATAMFGAFLGVQPYVDKPYYVGFRAGDQEVGLNPHGHGQGMTGPVCFREVGDIKAALQSLLDAGAEEQQAIKDVGGGKLTAIAKDADGNLLGLIQSP